MDGARQRRGGNPAAQPVVYAAPPMQYGAPVYGNAYARIQAPQEESTAAGRHGQSTVGRVVIIVLLVLILLGVIAAAVASGIAADEAKQCKNCKKRVRLEWDLAPEEECDDMNPCTADFIDHADDDDRVVCKNHPRPNGFPCNSSCFFREEEGSHRCRNLGKGCAECRGTRCKGECRRDRDCPTRRGQGPLFPVPQQAACMDGICIWEFFEEFRVINFPCDVEVLRRRCMRFVKPEFRDCIIAEPSCGIQFPRGKKRDELPVLPSEQKEEEEEEDQRDGHGGGNVGPELTRCAFSFRCARPKEPFIPKHRDSEHLPITKDGDDDRDSSAGPSLDSFLEDSALDNMRVEDFKKLTKKYSKRSSSNRRKAPDSSRHTIEGRAARREM